MDFVLGVFASFLVAIWLMFVITKRLAKISHGEKRRLETVQSVVLLMLLTMLCSFNGCVTSYCSGFVTVTKDYTTEARIGLRAFGIRTLKGFPVWYNESTIGIRAGRNLILERFLANWCVWTTVFMLICCRLYFLRTRSRVMFPAGITLGIGCAGIVAFLLLYDFDALDDPFVPTHTRALNKMRAITRAVDLYVNEHKGEFPTSLEELTKPRTDGWPPFLKKKRMIDPWGKPMKYELKGNSFTLRSSGPDRIMGTEDDITYYVADDEYRKGENR